MFLKFLQVSADEEMGKSRKLDEFFGSKPFSNWCATGDATGKTVTYLKPVQSKDLVFLYSVQRDRPAKCQSCHLLEDSIVPDCGQLQQLPVGRLVEKANKQKTKKGRNKATAEVKQKKRQKTKQRKRKNC